MTFVKTMLWGLFALLAFPVIAVIFGLELYKEARDNFDRGCAGFIALLSIPLALFCWVFPVVLVRDVIL